jgi:hypothetical protein
MVTRQEIVAAVAKALEMRPEDVSIATSNETVGNWDSLAHLSILESLDGVTGGKSTRVRDLASAFSVKGIIETLRSAGVDVAEAD